MYGNGKDLAEASVENTHAILIELYNRTEQSMAILTALAATQTSISQSVLQMSESAKSMAETMAKGEIRYSKVEDRLQDVNDRAAGKAQIPLMSHFIILVSACLVSILVTLYVHNQSLDASITSLKVGKP